MRRCTTGLGFVRIESGDTGRAGCSGLQFIQETQDGLAQVVEDLVASLVQTIGDLLQYVDCLGKSRRSNNLIQNSTTDQKKDKLNPGCAGIVLLDDTDKVDVQVGGRNKAIAKKEQHDRAMHLQLVRSLRRRESRPLGKIRLELGQTASEHRQESNVALGTQGLCVRELVKLLENTLGKAQDGFGLGGAENRRRARSNHRHHLLRMCKDLLDLMVDGNHVQENLASSWAGSSDESAGGTVKLVGDKSEGFDADFLPTLGSVGSALCPGLLDLTRHSLERFVHLQLIGSQTTGLGPELLGKCRWVALILVGKDGHVVERLTSLLSVLPSRFKSWVDGIGNVASRFFRGGLFDELAADIEIVCSAHRRGLIDGILVSLAERSCVTICGCCSRKELAEIN